MFKRGEHTRFKNYMHIPTKRWRGYYRALKSGKPWAIEFSKKIPLNRLFHLVYREEMISKILYSENPLMKLINKDEKKGNPYILPVILGLEAGITFSKKK